MNAFPNLDWSAVRFVWDFVVSLAVMVLTGVTWMLARAKANKAAIDRVDERLHDEIRRIDVMSEQMKNAPTHADIGHLHEKLNAVNSQLQRLNGNMEAMVRQLGMLHEHHLRASE